MAELREVQRCLRVILENTFNEDNVRFLNTAFNSTKYDIEVFENSILLASNLYSRLYKSHISNINQEQSTPNFFDLGRIAEKILKVRVSYHDSEGSIIRRHVRFDHIIWKIEDKYHKLVASASETPESLKSRQIIDDLLTAYINLVRSIILDDNLISNNRLQSLIYLFSLKIKTPSPTELIWNKFLNHPDRSKLINNVKSLITVQLITNQQMDTKDILILDKIKLMLNF